MVREFATLTVCALLLAPLGRAADGESAAARRQRIEAMTPAQKEELRIEKERFDGMPLEERDRLRRLHEQICGDRDAGKLQHVLIRYSAWLKTLPTKRRSELAALPLDPRIQEIKRILEQQERQRFEELVAKRLNVNDYKVIKEWFSAVVQRRLPTLLETVSPQERARLVKKSDPADMLFQIARDRRATGEASVRGVDLIAFSKDDIAQLEAQLSPEARRTLADAPDEAGKRSAIRNWVIAATFGRHLHRVSDEELHRFLGERVDARTRDYLENLPRDRMLNELRWMYYADRFRPPGGEPNRRGPRGGIPGEWPRPWQPGGNLGPPKLPRDDR